MEIIIFTEKITPRKNYVFKQVLGRILGFKVELTSKIEGFIAYDGLKFSYGKSRLGNELFIRAKGLLDEQGVVEQKIRVKEWEDTFCFYSVGEKSDVPFDIFSASFFLLSRYEEYLPHVKNELKEFRSGDSIAYKNKFLRQPVIDVWAYKFKELLSQKFPDKEFPKRKYETTNILTVSELYKYRKKGFMRIVGGGVRELFTLRIKDLMERLQTIILFAPDPYDIYKELLKFSKPKSIKWKFAFQLSSYSVHSKNIAYNRMQYKTMIKSMADSGEVGLLVGYEAIFDKNVLKIEKKRWESVVNRDLEIALSNGYGINLPKLYNHFDELEIGHDFSMGYTDKIGFRAGTCTPFLFYDLNMERISPLIVHPFVFTSLSFRKKSFFEVKTRLEAIKKQVEQVDGKLLMIYANTDFEEGEFKEKYYRLLELMNEE